MPDQPADDKTGDRRSVDQPLPPFRLIYQEPRDPQPGLCGMMETLTFTALEDARREVAAMRRDPDRKPIQIVDANRRVIWDEYEHNDR